VSAPFCIVLLGEGDGWGILACLSGDKFKLVCSGCTQRDAEEYAARLNRDEERERKERR
jgi:hypothetical protein